MLISRRAHVAALRRDGQRRRLALRRAGRRAQRLGVPSRRGRVSAGARGRAGDSARSGASCSPPPSPATKSASASASSSAARTTRSSTRPAPPARSPPPPRPAACCGLSPGEMQHAFGSAGTQAAGLWEFLRDAADSKQLHTAKAAADGLLAAYLAQRRLHRRRSASSKAPQGMAAGMSTDADPARLTDRLGERWALAETSFKFHASCRHTHPAADALLQVVVDHDLAAGRHRAASPRTCTRPRSTCWGRSSTRDRAPGEVLDGHGARADRDATAAPGWPNSSSTSAIRAIVAFRDRVRDGAATPRSTPPIRERWIGKVDVATTRRPHAVGARRRAEGRPGQHALARRARGQGAAPRRVERRGDAPPRCARSRSASSRSPTRRASAFCCAPQRSRAARGGRMTTTAQRPDRAHGERLRCARGDVGRRPDQGRAGPRDRRGDRARGAARDAR